MNSKTPNKDNIIELVGDMIRESINDYIFSQENEKINSSFEWLTCDEIISMNPIWLSELCEIDIKIIRQGMIVYATSIIESSKVGKFARIRYQCRLDRLKCALLK
ncbi:MAG: hypothetical protein COT06_05120 [Syntrophobacteraceae bacterium CG07_land_8_20_14_0_80_61_8]|nr:MAG: hypothetical protein COT06_05120 [Syntrophobacteraceae bacterium CG07_land_8_20_14_0_80_61_8]